MGFLPQLGPQWPAGPKSPRSAPVSPTTPTTPTTGTPPPFAGRFSRFSRGSRNGQSPVPHSSTPSTASTQEYPSFSSGCTDAADVELRQVSCLYFTEDGKDKRSHFEAMSVRVIADEDKPLSKQLHMKAGSGRTRTVSLLGARAWVLNVASKPGDVQPSFSENSVCIRESVEAARGWIVAHPSATNQRNFLELLCRAGCLVRDLPDHIAFLPEADQPSATLRLARPTSSRTATAAEIVAVKVTAEEDKMLQR